MANLNNKGNYRHGHSKRNFASRTYRSWDNMIQRCTNSNRENFKRYGGRGIKVCSGWVMSFKYFLRDMGERPIGTTLDRIDVDGHYVPDNCKWSTPKEQRNNRRRTVSS